MPIINTRSLSVSILGAVLWAAPLVRAQNVKPADRATIQELALQPQPLLAAPAFFQVNPVAPPPIQQQDLSTYREFQLGMSLLNVAKLVDMKPSEASVIHQRPAVIQELEWLPQSSLASSSQDQAIDEILFSFYNGELFRLVVSYDSYKTEGLTDEDMIEAISAKYGNAARPAAKIALSSSQADEGSEEVLARWENSQYSINLFRSSDQRNFGMLMFSKRLDVLARTAATEAVRLDEQEAPQRAIELQQKQNEENQAAQATARLANKVAFRP
jgi:hypothetical protein